MEKPMFTHHDMTTGIETQREMTDEEIAALREELPDDLAS
jgi:hypothetical protein